MKKLIFTVAVLATMLASCSNNEVYDVVDAQGNSPISFTNLNDKVSRAANDKGDNYKVYAKSGLAGETTWFIDDAVKNDNSTVSGGLYFWPSGATVDFYAWAPAAVAAKTPTYSPLSLSIEYTVPASADEDFTIAAPMTNKDNSVSNQVSFQFSHMLSKISVSAVLTEALTKAGYALTFTSAELKVARTKGTIDPTATTPAWTSSDATAATYTVAHDKSCMIMPQASTGCSLQLQNVTITKGGATVFTGNMKAYTIAADKVTGNNFVKGSHYNLKFTVDVNAKDDGGAGGSGNEKPVFGDAISFESVIAGWDEVTSELPQP